MNPNPDPAQIQREQMEVRLVALLLGESSAFEEAELVKAMEADASLTAFYQEMRRTLGLLQEASKSNPPAAETSAPPIAQPKLSAERRAALLAKLKQPTLKSLPDVAPHTPSHDPALPPVTAVIGEPLPLPKSDRLVPRWATMGLRLAALFIVLGVLAALLLPAFSTAKMKAKSVFAMQEMINPPAQQSAEGRIESRDVGWANQAPDLVQSVETRRANESIAGRSSGEETRTMRFRGAVVAADPVTSSGAAVDNFREAAKPAEIAPVKIFLPQDQDAAGVELAARVPDNGRVDSVSLNEFTSGEARGRTLNRGVAVTEASPRAAATQTDFFDATNLGQPSSGADGAMGGGGGGRGGRGGGYGAGGYGGNYGGGRPAVTDSRDAGASHYFAYAAKPQSQTGQAVPGELANNSQWFGQRWDVNQDKKPDTYHFAEDFSKPKVADAPALGTLFGASEVASKGLDVKGGEALQLFQNDGDGTFARADELARAKVETYARQAGGQPQPGNSRIYSVNGVVMSDGKIVTPETDAGLKQLGSVAAPAGVPSGNVLGFGLATMNEGKASTLAADAKPVNGPAPTDAPKPVVAGGDPNLYSLNTVGFADANQAMNPPAGGGGTRPAASTPVALAPALPATPPPPPPAAQPMPAKPDSAPAEPQLALKDLKKVETLTAKLEDSTMTGIQSVGGAAGATPPSAIMPPPAPARPAGTVTVDPASGQVVTLGRTVARDELSALSVEKSLNQESVSERFARPAQRELAEVNQTLAEAENRAKQQVDAERKMERLPALQVKSQQSAAEAQKWSVAKDLNGFYDDNAPVAAETKGRKNVEFDAKVVEQLKRQAGAGADGVALVTNVGAAWADYDSDGDMDLSVIANSDVLLLNRSIVDRSGGVAKDANKHNQQMAGDYLVKQAQGASQLAAGKLVTDITALGDRPQEQIKTRLGLEVLDAAKKEAAQEEAAAGRRKSDVADRERVEREKLSEVTKAKSLSEARELKSEAPAPRPAPAPALVHQPEVTTAENSDINFSTFSLNVSDVAFKTASASLSSSAMPDPNTVRVEEFINAFKYRDPAPAAGAPLALAWERARHPFAHNRDLLRFSVQTAAQGREAARPLNLVILLDNSGSMERPDRVQIMTEALKVLANKLQPQDKISVVAFSRTARLWVDGLPGGKPGELMQTVANLNPQGGTDLEAGLNLAYQTAVKHFLPNGNNRVIMLTDGAANLGEVEPEALKQKVVSHRQKGIALDCFGVGWEGYADDVLETLSRNGDGRYAFLNDVEQAGAEFGEKLAGALSVAASDVKTQVEFNPQRVTAYRQIGYAKHQLTKQQFRDNTVDAAEIAAAETGNAMYVIQVNPQGSGPLGVVRVRFKEPATGAYIEKEWTLPYQPQVPALDQSSAPMRLASVAATFGEWLARNPYAAEANLGALAGYMNGVPEFFAPDPRPKQLAAMLQQAMMITGQK